VAYLVWKISGKKAREKTKAGETCLTVELTGLMDESWNGVPPGAMVAVLEEERFEGFLTERRGIISRGEVVHGLEKKGLNGTDVLGVISVCSFKAAYGSWAVAPPKEEAFFVGKKGVRAGGGEAEKKARKTRENPKDHF